MDYIGCAGFIWSSDVEVKIKNLSKGVSKGVAKVSSLKAKVSSLKIGQMQQWCQTMGSSLEIGQKSFVQFRDLTPFLTPLFVTPLSPLLDMTPLVKK